MSEQAQIHPYAIREKYDAAIRRREGMTRELWEAVHGPSFPTNTDPRNVGGGRMLSPDGAWWANDGFGVAYHQPSGNESQRRADQIEYANLVLRFAEDGLDFFQVARLQQRRPDVILPRKYSWDEKRLGIPLRLVVNKSSGIIDIDKAIFWLTARVRACQKSLNDLETGHRPSTREPEVMVGV